MRDGGAKHVEPSKRLTQLGLTLPPTVKPVANFLPYKRHGNLLFLSGQGPVTESGFSYVGKVGRDVSVSEAYEHARLTTLNLLAIAHAAAGSIDHLAEITKVLGFVNAVPDFTDHPAVMNGCSDLLVSIFGERGRHSRSAIGVGSLPNNITVEIEMIVAVGQV